MPIEVYSGRPGSGKSNKLASTLIEILNRNLSFWRRTKKKTGKGTVRPVYTNFHLRSDLEKKYLGLLKHWTDLEQLEVLEDCDVFIDEIASYFDAKHWAETSLSTKRWLQQHRKLGIEIYGNCQDFAQVDVSFRRMTSHLYYLVKVISSRDPSPTKPPVKYIWGVSIVYRMSPTDYKENQKENSTKFDNIMFITRKNCEIFNTREKIIPGKYPPLKHTERYCSDPKCDFKRVIHS
jgi:hypothetical protein